MLLLDEQKNRMRYRYLGLYYLGLFAYDLCRSIVEAELVHGDTEARPRQVGSDRKLVVCY